MSTILSQGMQENWKNLRLMKPKIDGLSNKCHIFFSSKCLVPEILGFETKITQQSHYHNSKSSDEKEERDQLRDGTMISKELQECESDKRNPEPAKVYVYYNRRIMSCKNILISNYYSCLNNIS